MLVVFSLSQLQYFQFSTVVKLYKKNKETQKFCPLAPIFHLAPYLIFTATLKSIIPESLVFVTKNEQFRVKSADNYPHYHEISSQNKLFNIYIVQEKATKGS